MAPGSQDQSGGAGDASRVEHDRNLVALVSATGLANLADGIIRIELPLIAAKMTSDPIAIGALVACFSAPWLLTSFHIGVLVDRLDRRLLLAGAHVGRFASATVLLVVFAAGAGNLLILYPVALVLGIAEVVAMTCETAIVPMAVSPARLSGANAWITALETLGSESIGPALGGLLFAIGAGPMLLVPTLGFLVAGWATTLLRGTYRARETAAPGRMGSEGAAGLRFLLGRKDLAYMTLIVGAIGAGWSAWRTLFVLFAVSPGPMHLSSGGYGLLAGMLGVGGLVGAILTGPVTKLLGRRLAMFTAVIGMTAMLGSPTATSDTMIVGATIFLAGFGSSLWSVNSRSIVQETVPANMIGRFYSIYRMISWSFLPVGGMASGIAARSVGLHYAFVIMAFLSALQILPFALKFRPSSPVRA